MSTLASVYNIEKGKKKHKKNYFIHEYIKQVTSIIQQVLPDAPEEMIKEVIKADILENFRDPKAVIYNNYKNEETPTTLLSVIDLLYSEMNKDNELYKPILSGVGVLHTNHVHDRAPLAQAMQSLLDERKVYKGMMFDNMDDLELYRTYKLIQEIYKLLANSIYGVLGMKSSIFYNQFSATAITYTGVLAVTTAVVSFEAFLSGNIIFKTIDDFLIYHTHSIEDYNKLISTEDGREDFNYLYGDILKDENMVDDIYNKYYDFIESKLKDKSLESKLLLEIIMEKLTDEELLYSYYRNNLRQFFELTSIKTDFITKLINYADNDDSIKNERKDLLDDLYSLIRDFVVCYNIPFHREEFVLNNHRYSSILTDTDSTFLNLAYYINTWNKDFSYTREDENNPNYNMDESLWDIKLSNIMISILSDYIADMMELLSNALNVEKENHTLNMKSEYLYSRLLLTDGKKNYAGILIAQEGNILEKPKLDIKGLSVKKITSNANTRDFFSDLLENYILSSGRINLGSIFDRLKSYERTIIDNINAGSVEYLKPTKVNNETAYKVPYQQKGYRGVVAWNEVYPDNTIQLPENLYEVPLTCDKSLASIDAIKDYPEYDIIKSTFYDDPDLSKYGFNVFCVPRDEVIPEWVTPLIDMNKIVSANMSGGQVILKSLDVVPILMDKPGTSDTRMYTSNLIKF